MQNGERINPYCAGAGKRPAVLAGRGRQLAMVDRLITQFEGRQSAEDIVWTGLRGMGKTVLFQEVLDRLRDRGWLAGYHEARRGADIGQAVASILVQGQAVLGRGRTARAMSWLRELVGSTSVSVPLGIGDVAISLGLQVPDRRGTREDALDALFIRLGEAAADAGVGAAFLLDELQLMERHDLSALLHAAQAAEGLPVAFLGAGLPDLPLRLAGAGAYSERLFYDRLDWLTRADVIEAISAPAAEFGVHYSDDALDLLVERARFYPYFVQLYAEESWWAAGAPSDRPGTIIGSATVKQALGPAERRLEDGLYRIRFEKASSREQEYLIAMSKLGEERAPSGEVARRLGISAQQASPLRDRLIGKGVLYSPAHGVVQFSVPGFGDYLRRTRT